MKSFLFHSRGWPPVFIYFAVVGVWPLLARILDYFEDGLVSLPVMLDPTVVPPPTTKERVHAAVTKIKYTKIVQQQYFSFGDIYLLFNGGCWSFSDGVCLTGSYTVSRSMCAVFMRDGIDGSYEKEELCEWQNANTKFY